MKHLYNRALFILCFVLCVFSTIAHAQLADFTLTVSSTNETCPENGSLTFNATNTVPGASVLYNIFLLPNLNSPIATLGVNTLGGLSAGTYHVVATQSLNGQTSTMSQDITIIDTYLPLQFIPSIKSCAGNTTLTVNVTQGTAVSYEIFSGPVTFPLQGSNVFDGLPDGIYQIRVHDNCGNAVALPYTVTAVPPGLTIGTAGTTPGTPGDCSTTTVINSITPVTGLMIPYPLTYSYTFFPPNEPSFTITGTIASAGPNGPVLSNVIPYDVGANFSYTLTVTDACGNVYTENSAIPVVSVSASILPSPQQCQNGLAVSAVGYVAPYTITFLAAPPGFDPLVYNSAHPGPFSQSATYFNQNVPLPAGTYTVLITDSCGHTAQSTTIFDPTVTMQPLGTGALPGCEEGYGSILASSPNGGLVTAAITAAPAGFPETLPFDVTFNIASGTLYMNSLIQGNYTLHTIDECGFVRDSNISVPGYHEGGATIDVAPRCSGFDLTLHHQSNLIQPRQYGLQKLNPVTGVWGHPYTGAADGYLTIQNAIPSLNIQSTGSFRIIVTFNVFNNADPNPIACVYELATFEYNNSMQIDNVYSFSCTPTSYDVIVEASGTGPFEYRIIKKNGVPFAFNNGTSNIFYGLAPAIYTFEVEDSCGNILTTVYDATAPFSYVITATQFCNGQNGTLSVPAFSFINYEWWRDDDPTTILSTSPTLNFTPVNSATDLGLYHVRIYAPDSTPSCIDFTLDYNLDPVSSPPNAGSDTISIFCSNPGFVELTSLLSNNPDTSGLWTDSDGNQLASSYLNASPLLAGNYVFHYLVNGWCGVTAQSDLTIVIGTAPETPVISAEPIVCGGETLQLNAETISGANYNWTGPNGFTSTEQNPQLENVTETASGTYILIASSSGCESDPATVDVVIAPVQAFEIASGCSNDKYYLTATPQIPFDPDVIYQWNGPDGFTSSVNPVDISHLPGGMYSLTVTSPDGCSFGKQILVGGTSCRFPQGISPNNDGHNDALDLTGMDVRQLKIFNRYGMVVYDKLHYLNEWNGRDYRGNELPVGTYYYWVRLESGTEETGWVYLSR